MAFQRCEKRVIGADAAMIRRRLRLNAAINTTAVKPDGHYSRPRRTPFDNYSSSVGALLQTYQGALELST
jgi:hypothetical protein